ncbi:hypothetical protein FPT12_04205 [Pseudomonas sp. H3(2019)]|nr:hypothetical protein [Pseudomonas sp. H3(2019)]TVT85534.1 hypothetical protein FPT12_04205 [Pseudomonas sp. H3(2019)]
MSAAFRLPLQVFYEREARHPRQRFLIQPMGGGQVETLTWADVGHQARCAAHLKIKRNVIEAVYGARFEEWSGMECAQRSRAVAGLT